ncbi:hypothetical protein MSI_23130 [Treponema sp. JC4]|uniref:hypothetical protein n=1 Tax=Treponema sp. JC4 TaxID=1124982 RepID=UPI00025B079B|nr:hypothetical protein [Treponema sp. JC4]EID84226.1 hypothetical protein MSI_23130 [Treponema sp. JC4]
MDLIRELTIKYDSGKEAGIAIGQEQGRQEGAEQKAIEDAKSLLIEGDSPEKIARCIKLPIEKVLELKSQLEAEKK